MTPADAQTPKTPPRAGREIIECAASAIRTRVPDAWAFDTLLEVSSGGGRANPVFTLRSPDGGSARVIVESKSSVEARDVPQLSRRIRHLVENAPPPRPVAGLIAVRYLNARVQERLVEEGLNYADATGNLYISLRRPALFLRDVGAARDPWRGPGRPRDSFRGPIAARVVRALVDFAPPMTVPELIERSGVSTGAGYRVVDFLERQDLLEHKPRRPITRVDWRTILERWSRDFELNLGEAAVTLLAPRGIQPVRESLGEVRDIAYVLTGSAAAAHFEEYAQTRMAMIYTGSPDELAGRLGLRPVETGANVLLVRPSDDAVYERAEERGGVQVAAPSQVAVDLLNGPGRAPAEAQALLDWMERNEAAWRR